METDKWTWEHSQIGWCAVSEGGKQSLYDGTQWIVRTGYSLWPVE